MCRQGQAATLEHQRVTMRGLGGSCREGIGGFERFRGFKTCVQAKGRLQCWNADGQELGGSCREGCAGKGQAATLEHQRVTMRGLGGSCRDGKRQA